MTDSVLVTGAAGFVGGHVCRSLLDGASRVVGIDNFDAFYDRGIKEETIRSLSTDDRFSFVDTDIRDDSELGGLLKGVDVVVHLAARAGVRLSLEEPAVYTSVNVAGTVNVLEACRSAGVRRLVFASSSSVYGDVTQVPFREDAPAMSPISLYAATKRSGELICEVYSHLHGLRIAALRFFTVYGPRQRPDLAIHRFTRLLTDGSPIQQYGDGSAERDYTHIDDIVEGVLGAVRWTEEQEAGYDVFNLGESKTVRLDYLIRLIAAAVGVVPKIEVLPRQRGDVLRTFADISKARRVLGYNPRMSIEDGIVDFVDWYRGEYGNKSPSLA